MKSLTGQQNSQTLLVVAHLFYQHTFTVRKSYIVLDRTFKYSILLSPMVLMLKTELTLLAAHMEFVTYGTCVKFVWLVKIFKNWRKNTFSVKYKSIIRSQTLKTWFGFRQLYGNVWQALAWAAAAFELVGKQWERNINRWQIWKSKDLQTKRLTPPSPALCSLAWCSVTFSSRGKEANCPSWWSLSLALCVDHVGRGYEKSSRCTPKFLCYGPILRLLV